MRAGYWPYFSDQFGKQWRQSAGVVLRIVPSIKKPPCGGFFISELRKRKAFDEH
jgi:hypothetical protein